MWNCYNGFSDIPLDRPRIPLSPGLSCIRRQECFVTFVRNASITFVTKIGILAVALATSIAIARTIGPEGKGLFALVILVSSLVFYMTHLSIGSGSGYFLGRRGVSLEQLAGSWLSLSMIIGFTALGVSLLLAPHLVPRFLPDVPVRLVVIALFSVPFAVLAGNLNTIFKATNDFRRFNILMSSQSVSLLVSFVILYFVYPGSKIEAAVVAFLISRVLSGLLAVFLTARITKLRFHWIRGLIRKAVAFGVQAHFASFFAFLSLRIDLVLINIFMWPEFVGYYTVSVVLVEKIWLLPEALSVVLHPRVAHGSEDEANRLTSIVGRLTLLFTIVGCVGVLLLGSFFIELFYGERFLPSVAPLFLLLPGVIATSLTRVLSSDLLARGYPRVILFGGIASLIVNVALNLLLIPRYGIIGAAVATSISYSLNFMILLAAFTRLTGVSLFSFLIPSIADVRLVSRRMRAISSGK